MISSEKLPVQLALALCVVGLIFLKIKPEMLEELLVLLLLVAHK